ncbi:MAG: hypothetical protein KIS78_32470 [Labilithrix sp.]|nr:hypothetical protein [Labilithrix sp.]MCW5837154.1 hypothetical protein [Labilithrix sp.]
MDTRKRKTVYTIVERDGRCWWRPLGVGFVNPDGSIDVRLDAFPQSGALQLRDAGPRGLPGEAGT